MVMTSSYAHLDDLNDRLEHMVEILTEWSNINSGSLNLEGLERMSQELQKAFSPLSDSCDVIPLPPRVTLDSKANRLEEPLGQVLRFRKRPEAKRQIFLGGHYDTVFGAKHSFQYATRVDSNTLRGPGVADLKGGIVVMLNALMAFEKMPQAKNLGWEILLNPDEEISSPGSAPFFIEAAKRCDLGLIFEPGLVDGSIVGERMGIGNFTLVVHGRAAHAGRDKKSGRSAIVACAQLVLALEALNEEMPGVILNVGHIEGGGAVNIVPDLALCRLNIRHHATIETNSILTRIKDKMAEVSHTEGIRAELHGHFDRTPKKMTQKIEELFQLLKKCADAEGIPFGPLRPSGGVCDGNILAAAGLANIDTLGVRGGKIHSDEEFVVLASLVERSRLVARFLGELAEGKILWSKNELGDLAPNK